MTNVSLSLRERDYDRNYLELRKARSSILLANPGEAAVLIDQVETRNPDAWGRSLLETTKAELHQYTAGDIYTANIHWKKASTILRESKAFLNYAEVGRTLALLAQGELEEADRNISSASFDNYVEAVIIRSVIKGALADRKNGAIEAAARKRRRSFDEEVSYCGFWITALMNADAGMRRLGLEPCSSTALRSLAENQQIPYQEIVDRLATGRTQMPTAFVSYSQSGTPEKWIYDLVEFMRKNGVRAEYDQMIRGKGQTINFDDMMIDGVHTADFVVVVLSPDYAIRAGNPASGVAVEYKQIRSDIIRGKTDRYIFILHSGDYGTATPKELASIDIYDFRRVNFSSPDKGAEDFLRHLLGVERIDVQPVGPRPVLKPRKP